MAKYKISTWVSYVGWTEYEASLTREQAAECMEYTSLDNLSKEEFMALPEDEFLEKFKQWVEEAKEEGLSIKEIFGDDLVEESVNTNPTDNGPMEVWVEP